MLRKLNSVLRRAFVFIGGAVMCLAMTPAASAGNGRIFVEDELLVQPKAGVAAAKVDEALHAQGAYVYDEIPVLRVKKLKVPAQALEHIKAALARNPHFNYVENNYLAEATEVPNDSYYALQWHLPKITAPQGWDISTGASNIPVAIADSGVDPLHPDLAGKLIPGYNFYANTTDTRDITGHGTSVAGAAAALSNNGTGVAGVAWANPIMPIVISDATGWATYYAMAQAITYAADHGVRIVNISYGGTSSSSTLQNAVNYAWNKGTMVFASAGNSANSTPNYPAACDKTIAVSATTSSDTLASWSSYGSWVDVSAPGAGIYTTASGGGYASVSGTSFSSPITAGLAALILSVNPYLTGTEVVDIIKQNTDDLGAPGFDSYFGAGKINVYKSLAAAFAYMPQPDIEAPSAVIVSPATGSTVSGTVIVNVSAMDNADVAEVELYIDGVRYATDAIGPYSFSWDTMRFADGTHNLIAVAYDAAGNSGQSGSIAVTVSNPKDTTLPSIGILSPSNGALIGRKVDISANASDNIGVVRMELYIDGALKATPSGSALSYSWNTNKEKIGAHTIMVKAYDAAGNAGTALAEVLK